MDVRGNDQTISHLQKVLVAELTAINQYFLHSRMFENWGLSKLAKYEYEESIEEMRHADHLIKRILFLEGIPNLQRLEQLFIGEDVPEMLRCDLKLEEIAMPLLRDAIGHCENIEDYVSRDLFDRILKAEEEHVDFIETQLQQIELMKLENYIQLQSEGAED